MPSQLSQINRQNQKEDEEKSVQDENINDISNHNENQMKDLTEEMKDLDETVHNNI